MLRVSSTDEDVDMEVTDSENVGGPPAADSEQSGPIASIVQRCEILRGFLSDILHLTR